MSTGGVKIGSTYDEARTRKVNAEAEIAELELKKIHGELVIASEVVAAWTDVLAALKAKLSSIPTKGAPILASESKPAVCQSIIEDLVNEALEELSNYDPSIDPASASIESPEESDSNSKAAAKTNSKRVGRPRKTTRLTK
jgi:septation ring formation regulator EzrA